MNSTRFMKATVKNNGLCRVGRRMYKKKGTKRITRIEKYSVLKWQIISVIGLNLAYIFVISKAFSYYGYFQKEFNFLKISIGVLIMSSLLIMGNTINNPFYYAVWNIIFIYYLGGEIIYYQFNSGTNCYQIVSVLLILILVIFLSKIKIRFKRSLAFKSPDKFLGILSIVMFIPFLIIYYKHINLRNLLLEDIYVTRSMFSGLGTKITAYLKSPLSRVLLPVLIAMKLNKGQKKMALMYMMMIIYIFLCGALKSIYMGLIAMIIFYSGSYVKKTLLFLKGISFLTYMGTIVYCFHGGTFLVDAFIRRIFFVPAYLGNLFFNLFHENLTYLSHSPFGLGFVSNPYLEYGGIVKYVGIITRGGGSPNVGLITEGIFSFGFLGIIFGAVVVSLIILIFGSLNIDKRYFGIVFVYIYYINTALLSTLLLTHGLMFFIVMSYFFLSDKTNDSFESGVTKN